MACYNGATLSDVYRPLNLSERINQTLDSKLVRLLRDLGGVAQGEGLPIYLVGGSVRDLLLYHSFLDLDLVVEGDAPLLGRKLVASLGGEVVALSQFETAKLTIQGRSIDLTTARWEAYPQPGSLPTVRPGTLKEDVLRRDFSINALVVCLTQDRFGELIDMVGGLDDLRSGLVRVLHDNSFVDDATRILRAIRYEQRLDFRLETHTADLLHRDLGYLQTITPDRIRHEVERFLKEEDPARVLRRAQELGVLEALHPSLRNVSQVEHSISTAAELGEEATPILYLALLAWSVAPAEMEGLIQRLNLPVPQAKTIRDVQRVKELVEPIGTPGLAPSQIHRLLRELAPEALLAGSLTVTLPLIQERLQRFLTEWRWAKPLLTGHDLMRLGIPEGPSLGEVLEDLKRARLDGEVSSREEEEALVQRHITQSQAAPSKRSGG